MSTIKTNIKTTNFDLTDEITNYVSERIAGIEKYLDMKNDTEVQAHVEINKVSGEHHKHGNIYRAEINIDYEGKVYRSENTSEDIFTALEEATRKVSTELTKGKERSLDFMRKGGAAIKRMLRFGRED